MNKQRLPGEVTFMPLNRLHVRRIDYPQTKDAIAMVSKLEYEDCYDKALRYSDARWQNLTPSFPWIAPGWRAWGRNPRKGRDQILQRSVAEP